MKFIHLSDLHLGFRFYEYSLYEDQKYVLEQILTLVSAENPDGVFIAGDVYDKSVPSAESVRLLDDFLYDLSRICPHVFVISGNHDSADRIAFGGRLLERSGVHLSPAYQGACPPVVLSDGYGEVCVYLLPFLKPSFVREVYPDEEIADYTNALACAVKKMQIDTSKRNVLVCHQFVGGALTSDSELRVGGLECVDVRVFDAFDYVALGHIHAPQNISGDRVRYCGTPLKYSFSEAGQQKSITVVELKGKSERTVRTLPLRPLHEVREIRGTYAELTAKSFYENTDYRQAFLHITLTDEEDIPSGMDKLRTIYPNALRLDYDNTRTRSGVDFTQATEVERKTTVELFMELYEKQNGQPASDVQRECIEGLTEEKV